MQTAAVNTNAAASGAEDAGRCVVCAQREWQFSVLILKIVIFLSHVVRVFLLKDFRSKGTSYKIPVIKALCGYLFRHIM